MTSEPVQISEARQGRFRRSGLGYVWNPTDEIEIQADLVAPRWGELYSEITVIRGGRHLHRATFNLCSTRSRKDLKEALEARTKNMGIEWEKLIENFCVGVLNATRQGEPTRWTQAAPKRQLQYLADRLIVKGKSNLIFGPGGSGKGMLSVALCCAMASRRGLGDLNVMEAMPFYFDWEDSFDDFEDRLNSIARGFGTPVPRVPYRRMRGLAADRINEMARALVDAGASCAVIDSFSAAGGTASAGSSWDAVAHRFFDAIDMLPDMTWFIVGHVSGENLKDPVGKAFGSIQIMNRVRNAWEIRSQQEPGSSVVDMVLYDAKWNHTGHQKPFGLRMEFDGDAVTFDSQDPMDTGDRSLISIATRMSVQLAAGPLDTGELARRCASTENTVRSELRRSPGRFSRDKDSGLIRLVRLDDPSTPPGSDLAW